MSRSIRIRVRIRICVRFRVLIRVQCPYSYQCPYLHPFASPSLRLFLRLRFRDFGGMGSERYFKSRRVLYKHANAYFKVAEIVITNNASGFYTTH